MPAHIRTQIRQALITKLTGLTTTGSNIFGNRMEIVSDAELPALLVMNDGDQVAARSIGSQAAPHARKEQHTVSFRVRALAKINAALDDTLDQICKEVEVAINGDIFLGGLTDDARLVSTTHQFDASAEKLEGIAEMVWEFDTWINNTAPDVRA